MIRRVALVLVGAFSLLTGSIVVAEGETVRLGIEALESEKPYFDITLEPGKSKGLTVRFSNHGETGRSVAIYASDVYSIRGGGLGLRHVEEPKTGATTWLNFESETIHLSPDEPVERTFTVSVPEGTSPGDYITSISIQNADPLSVTSDQDQQFTQTVRHGVAVAIDVPGPREPAFGIGEIVHEVVAGRSVVLVDIANEGNAHVKPVGQFLMYSGDDTLLAEVPIGMDSVYAGTNTKLEIFVDHELEAGDYFASLSLTDEETSADALIERIPIRVGMVAESGSENETPAGGSIRTRDVGDTGGESSNIWLVLVSALSGLAALAGFAFIRRRNSDPSLVADSVEPRIGPRHDPEPRAASIADGSPHISRPAHFSAKRAHIRQLQPAKASNREYHLST